MSNTYVKDYLNIVGHRDGGLWIRMRPLASCLSGIRAIEGRKWHPDKKEWSIPDTEASVKRFISLFKDEPVIVAGNLFSSFPLLRICCPEGRAWRKRLQQKMVLKGFSTKTQKAYLGHVDRFIE